MTTKKLGIWMDHSSACLIESNAEHHSISSNFTFEAKEEALSRSENLMHNKENQMQEAYYKEIANKILDFNHVLLFGPTNAKSELHNYLKKDLHFKEVKIDIAPADQMSENEKMAFVQNHFNN